MPDIEERDDRPTWKHDMPVYMEPEARLGWMVELPSVTTDKELCRWLRTATDGLCGQAKLRIYSEVYVHYLEAVADEKAEGRTDEEARAAALAGLGDSKKARRAFRKTYLTEAQAEGLLETPKRPWPGGAFLFVLASVSVVHFGLLEPDWLMLMNAALLPVALFISGWLCPSLARQRQWRRAYIWRMVAGALFVIWFAYPTSDHGVLEYTLSLLLLVVFLPAMVWSCVSTLRKLGRHAAMCNLSPNDKHDGGRYA